MVKEEVWISEAYTISEKAKDADAKLLDQKKGAQGRDKELGRKEEEHRQVKDRGAEEEEWKEPNF